MLLHRVLVVAVVVAAAAAQPQRGRQTPFSMGMRLLENLRHGMTSTLQNIFGGGAPRGKEVPPAHQQAPNLDPGPPIVEKPQLRPHHQIHSPPPHHQEFHAVPPSHSPSHHPPHPPPATSHFSLPAAPHSPPEPPKSSFSSPASQGGQTSFFKVVHEHGSAAPTPNTHGFSGESFHPDSFLSGRPPFQGTVEEDHLVSVVHDVPQPLPLQNNDLQQDSFPPHKTATSFASFGNTASFKLGNLNREPDGHHPPRPRSILHNPPLPQGEAPHHSLRQDIQRSGDHPTVILLSNSRLSTSQPATQGSPPDTPAVSLSFEEQQQQQHHVAKKASASIQVQDPGDFSTGTRAARDAAVGDDAEDTSYEFGYNVLDDTSGNLFFHSELQEEGETRGSYKTKLPDGRVQTVTYVANDQGFHPKITYDSAPAAPEQDL
ncbi:uncharacterized protein LOC135089603 [Scylla paramamosain]|uniref:uncharacterized protein LOC135089603 n=1 Tax=Scylla paramamosain TaxID=85552 RepID=UPI003082B92C